jgi:hypothetical protein
MKASIRYLRELGTRRRKGPIEIEPITRRASMDKNFKTLLELRKQGSALMLEAEEIEYLDLTKEYR